MKNSKIQGLSPLLLALLFLYSAAYAGLKATNYDTQHRDITFDFSVSPSGDSCTYKNPFLEKTLPFGATETVPSDYGKEICIMAHFGPFGGTSHYVSPALTNVEPCEIQVEALNISAENNGSANIKPECTPVAKGLTVTNLDNRQSDLQFEFSYPNAEGKCTTTNSFKITQLKYNEKYTVANDNQKICILAIYGFGGGTAYYLSPVLESKSECKVDVTYLIPEIFYRNLVSPGTQAGEATMSQECTPPAATTGLTARNLDNLKNRLQFEFSYPNANGICTYNPFLKKELDYNQTHTIEDPSQPKICVQASWGCCGGTSFYRSGPLKNVQSCTIDVTHLAVSGNGKANISGCN